MEISEFVDELGPEKVLEVYDPITGMRGFTVIDNTALGPAKGGIRMTPNVDVKEVSRLARAMTLKNALAGLPFGGGKSGIIYDPKKDSGKKIEMIKAFSRAIKPICPSIYVAGPDVNTTQAEMVAFVEANGNFHAATGKPLELCVEIEGKRTCGLPHELGSTGYGVSYATQQALKHKKMSIRNATIAIEGFGNVGTFAFQHLEANGARIVAISDSKGCIYNPNGLKFDEVMRVKQKTGSVTNAKGKKLPGYKIFELPVDVLIPAAMPDVINKKNMNKVKAKIIVEAANIPMPLDVEEKLSKRILIIPDFVANAGGVISSYVEYIGESPEYMNNLVKERLLKNTDEVLKVAAKKNITPRKAAMEIALKRIKQAREKK